MSMSQVARAKIDSLLEKAISRKFLVWITASYFTYSGILESADWVIISGLYLGGQSVIDGIVKMKGLQ
tara:strand:- start:387 stop:590 length:204 start_codon:yes stop_codon:yes gene_type:complete